jgi:bacterioferritin-associated ferredoxin
MIICLCSFTSDTKIKEIVSEKSSITLEELQINYNICNNCRCCKQELLQYLNNKENKND